MIDFAFEGACPSSTCSSKALEVPFTERIRVGCVPDTFHAATG